MADPKISIALTAQDDASTKISALTSELGQMQEQLLASQAQVAAGQKDWLDYANQLGATAESMTNVVSGIEDIAIKSANDVKPIRGVSDPDDIEPYSVTLNLMTV